MRVLHIGKYFPPRFGGIETFMSQLMEEQAQQGLSVSAIVHADKLESQKGRYKWNSCDIYEVKSYGQLVFVPVAPSYPIRLKNALKEINPDVIHIHMPNVSGFWLLLFKVVIPKHVKIIIHWHSDVLGASPTSAVRILYPFYRIFESALLRIADNVIATSPPYLDTSSPLESFKNKSMVIPLGIKVSPCRKATNNNEVLNLIMIGRLTYYKNHEYVLHAIHSLKNAGVEVLLNIVGGGELATQLHHKASELNISDSVKFWGHATESKKNSLLSEADLLLLPSKERTEAFGVVLLEAALYRLPVVVSNVAGSGMSYVVNNQENGFVCDISDSNSLFQILNESSQNREELLKLGESNYKRLLKEFDIAKVTERISSLYVETSTSTFCHK